MGVDSKLIEETIASYMNLRALPKLARDSGIDYNRLKNYIRGRVKALSEEEYAKIHAVGVRDSGNPLSSSFEDTLKWLFEFKTNFCELKYRVLKSLQSLFRGTL